MSEDKDKILYKVPCLSGNTSKLYMAFDWRVIAVVLLLAVQSKVFSCRSNYGDNSALFVQFRHFFVLRRIVLICCHFLLSKSSVYNSTIGHTDFDNVILTRRPMNDSNIERDVSFKGKVRLHPFPSPHTPLPLRLFPQNCLRTCSYILTEFCVSVFSVCPCFSLVWLVKYIISLCIWD